MDIFIPNPKVSLKSLCGPMYWLNKFGRQQILYSLDWHFHSDKSPRRWSHVQKLIFSFLFSVPCQHHASDERRSTMGLFLYSSRNIRRRVFSYRAYTRHWGRARACEWSPDPGYGHSMSVLPEENPNFGGLCVHKAGPVIKGKYRLIHG